MGDFKNLKEALTKMNEIYMNFLSNNNHLLEVTKIYHHALRREEYGVERIGRKLEVAYVSLESTHKDLQESKLQIYQLLKELVVHHLSSCME